MFAVDIDNFDVDPHAGSVPIDREFLGHLHPCPGRIS
jgi:hypothetical protein